MVVTYNYTEIMIKNFEELDIWQQARKISFKVYEDIYLKIRTIDSSLANQINRSSGSVMDNIAEGFGRLGNREFIQFLSISKASCDEVKSQIYRAKDRSYISEEFFSIIIKELTELSNRIGGFMNYLKKSEISGIKFKR